MKDKFKSGFEVNLNNVQVLLFSNHAILLASKVSVFILDGEIL